jgi:hypothetical protein
VKLFHLTHHQGCIADIEYVGARLGLSVTSATFDDGYNIGPERADRAWTRWRDRLEQADVVLVSDTCPLARIVLRHLDEFRGSLVIWVCNRFDYRDEETNDCGFPDPAYYDEIRSAVAHPRVRVALFTAFEAHYARAGGVELGARVIKPTGCGVHRPCPSLIPPEIDRERTVFVPPYHNDTLLLDLAAACARGGVPAYSGRYGGPDDLRGFRAIVHIPYSWSTFALFEHLQAGLPMFVPSPRFLLELADLGNFWWPDSDRLADLLEISEWYVPEHDFLVRFESLPDLFRGLRRRDLGSVRARTAAFAGRHERETLAAWRALFDSLRGAVSRRS